MDLVKLYGADKVIDYTKGDIGQKLAARGNDSVLVVDNVGLPKDEASRSSGLRGSKASLLLHHGEG